MRKDHRRALAICLAKKRAITEIDLKPVYLTKNSRKNCLNYFNVRGWLTLDRERYGYKVQENLAREVLKS